MGGSTNVLWRLIVMTMVVTLFGCAESHESSDPPASTVKPIERVRQGIVDVADDLTRTNASSQELLKSGGPARLRFSKDLQSTKQHVETLRADATDLRDRASDYFKTWSGETVIVTNAGVAKGTDPRREAVKDKYDQFSGELVAAKDIVIPLMSEFQMMEARSDDATLGDDVRKANVDATQAIHHLNEAVKRLDELKNLAQARGD